MPCMDHKISRLNVVFYSDCHSREVPLHVYLVGLVTINKYLNSFYFRGLGSLWRICSIKKF